MTGVRWRPDTGFEGKCDRCLEWWPLADKVCWQPVQGLRRCRACLSEITNERNAIRRLDPAVREAQREGVRAYRKANWGDPEDRRRYFRELYRKNRDRVNARSRERYAERKMSEATRTRKREWMRAYRERMSTQDAA